MRDNSFMRKIIVIGASAGGIQSLRGLLQLLPADFTAPVMLVIHTTEQSQFLHRVLGRCCRLKIVRPESAEPIAAGQLYIAAPNRHLVVKSHCAVSWMGARENRHRPAVDTLFRSAARAYRANVIAIILSGAMDDGSAGALAVKARGGTVIVQNPDEAIVPEMPTNVLRQVQTDFCLPVAEISPLLVQLASKGRPIKFNKPSAKECLALSEIAFGEMEPTSLTCPECDGAVEQIKDGKVIQFRCHVGHAFSLESFTEAHADALERALWIALRKLNEQRSIQENLTHGDNRTGVMQKRHQENVDAVKRDIRLLHEILSRL